MVVYELCKQVKMLLYLRWWFTFEFAAVICENRVLSIYVCLYSTECRIFCAWNVLKLSYMVVCAVVLKSLAYLIMISETCPILGYLLISVCIQWKANIFLYLLICFRLFLSCCFANVCIYFSRVIMSWYYHYMTVTFLGHAHPCRKQPKKIKKYKKRKESRKNAQLRKNESIEAFNVKIAMCALAVFFFLSFSRFLLLLVAAAAAVAVHMNVKVLLLIFGCIYIQSRLTPYTS